MKPGSDGVPNVSSRAEKLYDEHRDRILRRTDRMFAVLIAAQWLAAVVLSITVTPYTFVGASQSVHVHVYAAVFLGGAISSLPIALAILRPGWVVTRQVIAVAQMLWSALLIHLTGGRLETHFHVFGSLTFLAFYRDWKVLVPAAGVVAADHLARGLFWPASVYGIGVVEAWRFVEHAMWVVYIEVFLIVACVQSTREMREVSERQGLVEAFSDRAKQKSAELDVANLRLEEQRALLSCQSEASKEGVLIVNPDGDAISHNRRFLEMWGVERPTGTPHTRETLRAAVLADVLEPEAFTRRLEQLYEDRSVEATDEIRLKDGRIFERYTAPICSAAGSYFGRGWYFRDITVRVRTGEELVALNNDLERRVEERTSALEGTNRELAASLAQLEQTKGRLILADRLAGIGQLSAGIAHEINNPLAYVFANLDYVLGEIKADPALPAETMREALEDAAHGAERVRKIVADLKMFARRDDERSEPVDLREVLQSSCKMAMNEIRHRGRLVYDLRDIPCVRGDAGRLGQVFLNLVINAAHALTVSRKEGNEIRISTRVDAAGQVIVEIADTGEGIPVEIRERIFDPFFTNKPIGVGTGLGLSICHGIVTSHGGEISVDSVVGEGSRFRVVLPAIAERETRDTLVQQSAPESGRRRALVIDDEPKILAVLERALGSVHHVDVAVSGSAALARIRNGETYDVILCDLMPEMSGMQVYEEIQRLDPQLARRVIFLTGGAFTAESRAFVESRGALCIEKPFRAANVLGLVARLSEEHCVT
jgi:signal transduction histidine kinase/ActR/RegA family two-component response regulator